uniref:Ribosomal RNA large subunit methyltransferase N n=1 Tax=uncultured bacterium contig00077 TaxID=1181555 RepID=A0A806JZ25_9BACT|nr:ribosomal RNA large subunit methyltransferase N [uncultured bacterium contig00077]
MENLQTLSGLNLAEIEEALAPLPRFRASQVYKWITRGIDNIDQMTDIPLSTREDLKSRFRLFSSTVNSVFTDKNASKIVLTLNDGNKIEAVRLCDSKKRLTCCLSTQAGCPAGCVFCKTGSLGFSRNLDCAEIMEQFYNLRRQAGENPQNIVIMGMGEPLLNLAELKKAISIFTDKNGLNFSRRRITVSTCGILAGLYELTEKGPFIRLALSLTTADEPLRQKLMPVTRANPLAKVKEALAAYQDKSGSRVTLEVPLLGGINSRSEDAVSIADFAKGMDTVINVIPWNPVAGLEFEGNPLREPEKQETENFVSMLEKTGLKVTTRHRKGRKVCGACGQLGVAKDISQRRRGAEDAGKE